MARIPVIDGDGHVMERPGEIMDFIEGRWDGPATGLINAPFPSLDGAHINASRVHGRSEKVSGTDAARWREFMDFAGIDEAVLYPTAALSLGLIHNPDWAAKAARGYNRWLHETHLKPEPRLHAPGILPTQDVSAAVEELRYCVQQLGMAGGMLCSVNWQRKPLGLPEFDPIYAEAERLGVPVILHGGTLYGLGLEVLPRFADAHVLEHPLPLFTHLTTMVYGGVFERFPRLKLGLFEAGSSWVIFMMDRLDYDYDVHKDRDPDLKRLTRLPSDMLKENVYVTCEADERYVGMSIQALGEDHVLYASDYPHELGWEEYPEDIEELMKRPDLSEPARRKLLADNARAFYRLPVRVAASS